MRNGTWQPLGTGKRESGLKRGIERAGDSDRWQGLGAGAGSQHRGETHGFDGFGRYALLYAQSMVASSFAFESMELHAVGE